MGCCLGLGRDQGNVNGQSRIVKSCYVDREVWFPFLMSNLSVTVNGFCIKHLLDTSTPEDFDVRENIGIQSYSYENVLNLCHLYCL